MRRVLARGWLTLAPILPVIVAVVLMIIWIGHLQASNTTPLTDYRVDRLEKSLAQMQEAHDRIMWLFVTNLAATIAATVTYLLTHLGPGRRRP